MFGQAVVAIETCEAYKLYLCAMSTGFELLTKKRILNKRPEVERLSPLTHDEFQQYVDDDGRVLEVDQLKQRIFRGVSE